MGLLPEINFHARPKPLQRQMPGAIKKTICEDLINTAFLHQPQIDEMAYNGPTASNSIWFSYDSNDRP